MAEPYEPIGFCPTCGYKMDAGTCPECGELCAEPSSGRRLRATSPRTWAIAFVSSGAMILMLAGAILLAEANGWTDRYFHAPQHLCVIVCAISAIQYLRKRTTTGWTPLAVLAWLAVVLSLLFIVFILLVVVAFTTLSSRF